MPKVSVLMPVYNTEEGYLREAIESILNQTYTDFEFLIIDDKSTNNAPDVIAEYAQKDKRIKVIQGQHQGLASALNIGLQEAKGKYIARMDSDDISLSNRFEKQVDYLENNSHIAILGCAFETMPNKKEVYPPLRVTFTDVLEKCPLCHPSVMMNKGDIIRYNLYYHNVASEDYDLWARAVRCVNIANLPDILVKYRVLENSFSHSKRVAMFSNDTKIKESLLDVITSDKIIRKKIFDEIYLKNIKLLQKVFSIRSRYVNGQKQKVLVLLGHCYPLLIKNSNHIVKIMGGLGNQMFQYAFGQNFDNVLYDISRYGGKEKRALDLELYNIERKYTTIEQTIPYLKKSKVPQFLRNWLNFQKYKNVTKEKQINRYEPDLLEIKNTYYNGYFQTEKYFKHLREKLLHDFTLSIPLDNKNAQILQSIKQTNSVAVHIRRGDYLDPKVPFVLLDSDYYRMAMDYIAQHVSQPHFYIFSNDFDWVRANIKNNYTQTIVDINDEDHGYFDLELMKNCKHNIIANSSFSWWGAWLNQNPDKIVVAPKQWFKPTAKECYDDMIPDTWHTV